MSNRDDSKEREEYFEGMRQQYQSEIEWLEVQYQQLEERLKDAESLLKRIQINRKVNSIIQAQKLMNELDEYMQKYMKKERENES